LGGTGVASRKNCGRRLVAVVNDFPGELWTLAPVNRLIEREFEAAYSGVNVGFPKDRQIALGRTGLPLAS